MYSGIESRAITPPVDNSIDFSAPPGTISSNPPNLEAISDFLGTSIVPVETPSVTVTLREEIQLQHGSLSAFAMRSSMLPPLENLNMSDHSITQVPSPSGAPPAPTSSFPPSTASAFLEARARRAALRNQQQNRAEATPLAPLPENLPQQLPMRPVRIEPSLLSTLPLTREHFSRILEGEHRELEEHVPLLFFQHPDQTLSLQHDNMMYADEATTAHNYHFVVDAFIEALGQEASYFSPEQRHLARTGGLTASIIRQVFENITSHERSLENRNPLPPSETDSDLSTDRAASPPQIVPLSAQARHLMLQEIITSIFMKANQAVRQARYTAIMFFGGTPDSPHVIRATTIARLGVWAEAFPTMREIVREALLEAHSMSHEDLTSLQATRSAVALARSLAESTATLIGTTDLSAYQTIDNLSEDADNIILFIMDLSPTPRHREWALNAGMTLLATLENVISSLDHVVEFRELNILAPATSVQRGERAGSALAIAGRWSVDHFPPKN